MSEAPQTLDLSYDCRRHLQRAHEAFPSLSVLDALAANAERATGGLTKNTIRVYIHDHRVIARYLVEVGQISEAEARAPLDRIVEAISARFDPTLAQRTSAKKSKHLRARELSLLFAALKQKALADKEIWTAIVTIMVLATTLLGARPVELTTIQHSGPYLRLQNAKRSTRASQHRVFDITRLPAIWVDAMVLLADVLGHDADVEHFHRRLRHLSQILGRISMAAIGRRICLYTLRHISIATWKRAGINPEDIALLAGHISARTARHYAPARSGHVGPILITHVADSEIPEGVFANDEASALLRPPRGARRRDWSTEMPAHETAVTDQIEGKIAALSASGVPRDKQDSDDDEAGAATQSSDRPADVLHLPPATPAPLFPRGWLNKRLRAKVLDEKVLAKVQVDARTGPKSVSVDSTYRICRSHLRAPKLALRSPTLSARRLCARQTRSLWMNSSNISPDPALATSICHPTWQCRNPSDWMKTIFRAETGTKT